MRTFLTALVLTMAVAFLNACSSPEKQRAKAEAEYTAEKTETLQDYKDCVNKAKGDEEKLKTCEALLKALEAAGGAGTGN